MENKIDKLIRLLMKIMSITIGVLVLVLTISIITHNQLFSGVTLFMFFVILFEAVALFILSAFSK